MPAHRLPQPRRPVVSARPRGPWQLGALVCALLLGWVLVVGTASVASAYPALDPAAPDLTLPSDVEFVVGRPGTSYLIETDGDPVPAIGVDKLPKGLQLRAHGDGTATLSGTATGPAGISTVQVRAQNTIASTTALLTVTVEQTPAFVTHGPLDFRVGELGSVDVRSVGFPAPSIGLDGDLPTGLGFVDNGDGTATIAGTPVDEQETGPVTLTAVNVVADASETVTIRVLPGTDEAIGPPVRGSYAEPRWDI